MGSKCICKERCFDRASKCGKFCERKQKKDPRSHKNTAICGIKLHWNSEHFSEHFTASSVSTENGGNVFTFLEKFSRQGGSMQTSFLASKRSIIHHNFAPRVSLRHTLIKETSKHPGRVRSNPPRKWADLPPLWICSAQGNTYYETSILAIKATM